MENGSGNRVVEKMLFYNRFIAAAFLEGELILKDGIVDFAIGVFMLIIPRIETFEDGLTVFGLFGFGD